MQKQTDSKANQPYMQRIQNSENLEFKQQNLKKKDYISWSKEYWKENKIVLKV